MKELHAVAYAIHALLAVIWVGGMFFAHFVLRPTALRLFEGPQRLALWAGVFERFFPWVWGAAVLLPATGFGLIFGLLGGFKGVHWSVHLMTLTGSVMAVLFVALFFVLYPRFRAAVAAADWPGAARTLDRIRLVIVTNLTLGLLTVAVATGGRLL